MEVTNEEFFSYLGGRASAEVKRRIAAELEVANSNVRRLLTKIDAVSERPFDINWRYLLTANEADDLQETIKATKRSAETTATKSR